MFFFVKEYFAKTNKQKRIFCRKKVIFYNLQKILKYFERKTQTNSKLENSQQVFCYRRGAHTLGA